MSGHVMTVTGAIPAEQLGITMIHEHLIADFRPMVARYGYDEGSTGRLTLETAPDVRFDPGLVLDNYNLDDPTEVADELVSYSSQGGRTIVECTPIGFRDPRKLKTVSELSGVQVVMGGSYYIESGHPSQVVEQTVDQIAEGLIAEYRDGFEDTGIRPGVIGEVGAGMDFSDEERKVVLASAIAAHETGLPLTIHVHPWSKGGLRVCDVLAESDLEPHRVVLNHICIDFDDDDYQRKLFDRGYYLAYDLFGFDHSLFKLGRYPPNDYEVGCAVARHVAHGFTEQVMVSQDMCVKSRYRKFGSFGYGHLLRNVVPLLEREGVTPAQVRTILVDNPRRWLTIDGGTVPS